jgi:hypothetical protein
MSWKKRWHFPLFLSNLVHTFVYIPVSEHLILSQDNPSTWQMWHIKKLITQHDHYTGAHCAGDNKRPLKCADLSQHNVTDISSFEGACNWHIRAVARDFNVRTISCLRHFWKFGRTSNRLHNRRPRDNIPHNYHVLCAKLMTIIHCASTCPVCFIFKHAMEEKRECENVRWYREQLLLCEISLT